jgi:hypothetical protein
MVPFGGFRGWADGTLLMQRGRRGAASFLRAERPGVRGMGRPLNLPLNNTTVSNKRKSALGDCPLRFGIAHSSLQKGKPSCRGALGFAVHSDMSKREKFLRLSYQVALMDTEEAIGLVVFGALICVVILLVAIVL